MKVIITSGYYNPLHVGHVNLLKESKKIGDFLVVIVNNDEQVKAKGSMAFMPEEERMEIIKNIKHVDHVFLSIDKGKSIAESLREVAELYQSKGELLFAKGGDRNADNIPEEEKKVCKDFNIEVISGVGGGKVQSSSWLLKNIVEKS